MPIKKIIREDSYPKFQEKVMHYLEDYGVPELVLEFEPEDVAKSLSGAMLKLYPVMSARLAAIVIWGMVLQKVTNESIRVS